MDCIRNRDEIRERDNGEADASSDTAEIWQITSHDSFFFFFLFGSVLFFCLFFSFFLFVLFFSTFLDQRERETTRKIRFTRENSIVLSFE